MGKIDVQNVTMLFPGVRALDGVSCTIEKGSVVALCGENGAGKSTLAKIIAGVHAHGKYGGRVLIDGAEVGLELDPRIKIKDLTMGYRQMVEISS